MVKMLHRFSKLSKTITVLVIVFSFSALSIFAQSNQVLLQGFWWDCRNNNYPNQWGDYMTELAPRLKTLDIDAVWIQPSVKNQGSTWVGYSPFDNYDLGDKYQKGSVKTIFGNKNELLRMVGVLHANGINVVQDIVYNHVQGAGTVDGSGGSDPEAWDNKYKNFRYVSFNSPVPETETAADYLSRKGRFPKNWQNFHGNPAHNCNSGDICADWFGPDVCYWSGAIGESSNATYNPTQAPNYMRDETRKWSVWYKKQVGFDGVRLDAVKHFDYAAAEDFLYNMQYGAGWANGGADMLAVGEYVGESGELDYWANAVQNRAGTFDFSLRGALYGVVTGGGFYNLGDLPGAQQSNRGKTVPFVNNHDTYRPIIDQTTQLITGWDSGQELAAHINSDDPRISLCYAMIMAVDGTPQIFFEDLFNLNNGKRYTHKPTNTLDLPVRDDINNLIWCRQNLNFMGGAYKVRNSGADHLIIERSAKAIISMNDTWDVWKEDWIDTDFAPGTVLKDYSGASTYTVTVAGDRRVAIKTPPCNGTALHGRRGYAVWAPVGITDSYVPKRAVTTTQEWEMADDLGDSHVNSLQEGGALPNLSTALRTIGRVYVEANKPINVDLRTSITTKNITVAAYKTGSITQTKAAVGNFVSTFTFPTAGWVTLKVQNTYASNPTQKVWAIVTYTAPAVVNTITADTETNYKSSDLSGEELYQEMLAGRYIDELELETLPVNSELSIYPNPTTADNINFFVNSGDERVVTVWISNINGSLVQSQAVALLSGGNNVSISSGLTKGIYFISIPELNKHSKLLIK